VKVKIVWTILSLVHHVVVQYFVYTFIVNLHILLSSFDNQVKVFPERLPISRSISDWRLGKPFIELKAYGADHYFRYNESAFT
jgi:hypothetical protein